MKVVFLLLLLPLVGCQDTARPTITDEGRSIASPKNAPKALPKTPVKKPAPVADKFVVPSEFAKYVDRFYVLMGKAGLDNYRRSVQFIMDPTLTLQVAGNCSYASTNGYAIIRINPNYWWNYEYHRRESLMFHELGHCVLNRGHIAELYPNKRAKSVMHPNSLPYADEYLDYYREYLAELFWTTPEKYASTEYHSSYYGVQQLYATNSISERNEYISLGATHADLPPGVKCGSH